MKKLPLSFIGKGEVSGVRFDQIFRQGNACIYFRNGRLFEVIRIRFQQAKKNVCLGGILIDFEARERYPKSSDWTTSDICTDNVEIALESACRILGLPDKPALLDWTAFDLSILPLKLKNDFLKILDTAEKT